MDEDPLPISLIADFVFCPRRAWLEMQGERVESAQIQQGTNDHAVADRFTGVDDAGLFHAIDIRANQWNLSGRLDAVQLTEAGAIIREYKATPVKREMRVTDAMRIQLALQAMCLQEMGYNIAGTQIFFTSHHRRVDVELTSADFHDAECAIKGTRALANSDVAPEPFEDSPRCMYCSHVGICLPDERKSEPVNRRIVVKSPDYQVTHIATPGAKLYVRSGRMIASKAGEEIASIPIETISALEVHGNCDLSSALIRELLWRNVPILWCSGTGRFYGWAQSSYGPNGQVRVRQHVASETGRLGLAREFIATKIHNQRILLRRSDNTNEVLPRLKELEKTVKNVNLWQDVLGLEGEAASLYFSQFSQLIKPDKRELWQWQGRARRPAPDALNSMLDYSYALLLADCVKAIIACGLDPHAGFIHSSKRNKPALALDLMEEFRAPIADSVVQTVVNNGEVKPSGFTEILGSVRMDDCTRKSLIGAYERRMETQIVHPVFGYKASWRRVVEIQARMILGYLDGTQSEYHGMRIR